MRTGSIKFHISPYGSASSAVESLVDRGVLQRQFFHPFSRCSLPERRGHFYHVWLAFSHEVDETFVKEFRRHSTPETRLLVMDRVDESRTDTPSVDTLLKHLLVLQIRSPQRVYVAGSFGAGKSHLIGALLERLVSTLKAGDRFKRILDARIEGDALRVVSPEFERLDVPISKIPSLAKADPESLADFEIDEDGSFVYWPRLDVHLGWEQFEQILYPEAARKAQQKCRAFNVLYGKAIQYVREQAGLKQSDIPGMSEKQVRRVEKGECRLTSNGIDAFSEAHNLSPNEYLKTLAAALKQFQD